MNHRRLQVFISSTFTDLIPERQAAVEAILASGHIPAGMELFTAGDESQMSVIKRWIDESDVYLLILGHRYGSVEPQSGKSYTELEYDYAVLQEKPLFSLVADNSIEELRVKNIGLDAIERKNPDKLHAFRNKVLQKIVKFWMNKDQIKVAIHETMTQFSRKPDLVGWTRLKKPEKQSMLDDFIELPETQIGQVQSREEAMLYHPSEKVLQIFADKNKNPKLIFDKQIVDVERGRYCFLLSKPAEVIHKSAIKIAAGTMGFIGGIHVVDNPENVLGNISKAEMLIFDISEFNPILFFYVGIALSVRDEHHVLIICRKNAGENSNFLKQFAQSKSYDPFDNIQLANIISKAMDKVRLKRKRASMVHYRDPRLSNMVKVAKRELQSNHFLNAEKLLQEAFKLEKHWYVSMILGIIYRQKSEWEKAEEYFNIAIDLATYNHERTDIYIEQAIMCQILGEIDVADSWFHKARNGDSMNIKIYFTWAKFWDDVGKTNQALEKVNIILTDIDVDNQRARSLVKYYSKKIADPTYNKSFSKFIEEKTTAKKPTR